MRKTFILLNIFSALTLFSLPSQAQRCASDGSRARVCRVEFMDITASGRPERVDARQGLAVRTGETVVLDVVAYDQSGREFPDERNSVQVEGEGSCRGRIDIEQSHRRFTLKGLNRGDCSLTFWIPGNLNLEWTLPVSVGDQRRGGGGGGYGSGSGGYNDNGGRPQDDRNAGLFIASRLYSAILGREGDRGGVESAADSINQGRLEEIVDGLVRSQEFQRERSNLSPSVLLQSFYRGLLDRDPDTSGIRTYLDDVQRHRFTQVVMSLLRSPEFQNAVPADERGGRRRY